MKSELPHNDLRPGLDRSKWPWTIADDNELLMDGPSLSIITPSWNQAGYLEATMLSVLRQAYPQLAYLVIDGASNDGSAEIIRKYAGRLTFWESEPDNGQAHAINKGIKQAGGEWIAFINSDDFFLPGAFAALAEVLRRTEKRWIAAGVAIRGDDGADYGVRYPEIEDRQNIRAWLTYRNQVPQQGCLIHRSVFDEIGMFDEAMHNAFDLDFWVRMAMSGIEPEVVHQPVAVFRVQEESKSMTGRLPFIEDHRRILDKFRGELSRAGISRTSGDLDAMEANARIYRAAQLGEETRKAEALRELGHAFRLSRQSVLWRPFWGAVKRTVTG